MAENNGTTVQSSAQNWTFTKQDDGTYTVRTADGKALMVENDSSENGADIILSDYTGGSSQKFTIRCNKDGTYSMLSVSSGGARCVDVYEMSKEDGANICQWEFWGGDGQKFILEPAAESIIPEKVTGVVNADGEFSVADLVMMQRFLLGAGTLNDWEAGDLCKDDRINSFDMIIMRRMIASK